MDIPRLIRETVAAAEARVMQFARNLVQLTTVSRSTAKGEEDGAEGWPDSGKAYQRSTRRMQHFGFRSRPPKNSAAVMLLVGGGSSSEVTVAEGSDGYGPVDLADGELAIFSKKSGTQIVLRANGQIEINSASDADVVVNGGTAKVGRVGDQVKVTIPINALTLAVSGANATGPAAPLEVTGTITVGADHLKA